MPSTPLQIFIEHVQSSAPSVMCKFGGKLVCFVTVKPFAFNYYSGRRRRVEVSALCFFIIINFIGVQVCLHMRYYS